VPPPLPWFFFPEPPMDAHGDRAEQTRPETAAFFAGEPEGQPVSLLFSFFSVWGFFSLWGKTRVCTLKLFHRNHLALAKDALIPLLN
jgi:hypothetical protein